MTFNFGGGSTAPATGFSLNSTATTTAQSTGFGFGSTAAKQPAGVSFGLPSSAPTAAVAPLPAATKTPAVSFGSGAPAASGLTLNFGTPAAAPTAAPPAFGATTTSAPAPAFGGFGATAATSNASTFGAPAAASSASTFGAPAATSNASTFGAPAFGAAASTAATGFGSGFGFGTTTTISQAPAQGLNMAATTTTGTQPLGTPGLGGLGGTSTTAAGLGGAPVLAGLGGANTQQGLQQNTQEGKNEGKAVKETMIPTELGSTVEELKKIMKEEKSVSSDISHVSAKPYNKIKDETEALSQLVSVLGIGVQKNRTALDRLKGDTAQELVNVETAQRTKETPPAMQYENVAPLEYFTRLVGQFEFEMTNYRKQIQQTELHLQAMGNSDGIRSQDLTLALQKLHEAFTDLAAKYGGIHQQVAKQKEHYLNIHRHLHGTNTSLFSRKTPGCTVDFSSPALPSLVGPSPFTGPQDPLAQARAHLLNHTQQPQPTQAGPPTLGLSSMGTNPAFKPAPGTAFGSSTGAFGNTTTGFGGTSTGFGANTTGFGGNTSAFAANTTAFGAPSTSAFGATATPGFGAAATPGFGASTPAFGGGFASPAPAFGANNSSVFGSPTTGNKRGKH